MKYLFVGLFCISCSFMDVSGSPLAPGDDFADAIDIGSSVGEMFGVNTSLATSEEGESFPESSDGKSQWFRWTAPADGTFHFGSTGSSVFGVLDLFTGDSLGQLTRLGTVPSEEEGAGPLFVTTSAVAGEVFFIRITGFTDPANDLSVALSRGHGFAVLADETENVSILGNGMEPSIVRLLREDGDLSATFTAETEGTYDVLVTSAFALTLEGTFFLNSDADPSDVELLSGVPAPVTLSARQSLQIVSSGSAPALPYELTVSPRRAYPLDLAPLLGQPIVVLRDASPALEPFTFTAASDGFLRLSVTTSGSLLTELDAVITDVSAGVPETVLELQDIFRVEDSQNYLTLNTSEIAIEVEANRSYSFALESVDRTAEEGAFPVTITPSFFVTPQTREESLVVVAVEIQKGDADAVARAESLIDALLLETPTDALLNTLKGLIEFSNLTQNTDLRSALESLGAIVTDNENGVPSVDLAEDENGTLQITEGARSGTVVELVDDFVRDGLVQVRARLASVSENTGDSGLSLNGESISVDRVDLLALTAGLDTLILILDLPLIYDLDFDISVLSNIDSEEGMTLEEFSGMNRAYSSLSIPEP